MFDTPAKIIVSILIVLMVVIINMPFLLSFKKNKKKRKLLFVRFTIFYEDTDKTLSANTVVDFPLISSFNDTLELANEIRRLFPHPADGKFDISNIYIDGWQRLEA